MALAEQPDYAHLTVQLLSAYLVNNPVASQDLPTLVRATRAALTGDAPTAVPAQGSDAEEPQAQETPVAPVEEAQTYKPAVSVEESLASADVIISMIDGKPYRALKQHLARHGLSPMQYRERYDLPADYPLVAPSYSELRRAAAKRIGLGRRAAAPASAESETVADAAPAETVSEAADAPAKKAPAKGRKTAAKARPTSAPSAKTAKPRKRSAKVTDDAPRSGADNAVATPASTEDEQDA
ncbi:hypothetical protein BJF93_08275 [Xaviernesmea oryzae]|uniref:MucR family transcriptional regulator n=1 Tax=Xaviernesmea oryzae TaxID=464029 RepID=A0A1Q9B0S2_9HYPH|nr:MucR family transcriptional regulator [Xaviernesmea oryzae]OLP61603.1 hypothetical protein BJF93_08275 [Xaviernesmea oryzae]SEL06846.1 transcriptional regulator, MucR family [Xaviernesmea oryzae]